MGNSQPLGSAVRRPTRFKIEAQMKHEIAHRSSVSESIAASWDAGSTLFDSFELDALLKTLDEAANPPPEQAGAIVVYSQKHWLGRPQSNSPQQKPRISPTIRKSEDDGRLVTLDETRPLETGANELKQRAVTYKLASNLTLDELYEQAQKEAEDDPFASFSHTPSPFNVRRNFRRSFDSSLQEKPGKGSSHNSLNRSKWKSLLHTLHLDSASGLFHRFQGFHAQVAPHDSQKKLEQQKETTPRRLSRSVIVESKSDLADAERLKLSLQKPLIIEGAPFDPRFDPKNLHISKDVNPPPEKQAPQKEKQRNSFWKSGLKAVFGRQTNLVTENDEPLIPKAKKTDLQSVWQKKSDLQSAWSSFTSTMSNRGKEHEQGQRAKSSKPQRSSPVKPVIAEHHYHHHHHHHHVSPEPSEDFELTVQAISKRVHRSSFEEKLNRRFSLEGSPPARPAPVTPSGQRVQRVHLTPRDAEKKGYGYSSKAGPYVH